MEISSPLLLNLNSIQREVDEDESLRKLSETIVSFGQAERGFCVKKGSSFSKVKSFSHAILHLKTDFLRNMISLLWAVTRERKRLTNAWLLIYIGPV